MIEEFISRSLMLALGYAYPAFQCFKTLEKAKVAIGEVKFWCQYWIIVAVLTVVENYCDIFLSWLPFYQGIKLIMCIYLWHPSTKGSGYVYETLLKPYVSKHEKDIDRSIAQCKQRAWEFVLSYWQNCAESTTKKTLQLLKLLVSQSVGMAVPTSQNSGNKESDTAHPPSTDSKSSNSEKRRRPPVPPAAHRSQTQPDIELDTVRAKLKHQKST